MNGAQPQPAVDTRAGRLHFGIARWRAWSPAAANKGWQAWLDGSAGESEARPRVDFLPPRMRRRLDGLGRMALSTAWPCAGELDHFEFVFGSRHGSLARTAKLLAELINDEPLSPAGFSLAVHNSTAGLFSIARANRCRATAMAAGRDSLTMALLEGALLIAEGAPRVIVTYAEDVVPEAYAVLVPTPRTHPFAVSLLLTPVADAPLHCAYAACSEAATDEQPEAALMRFLSAGAPASVVGVEQRWRLERLDG